MRSERPEEKVSLPSCESDGHQLINPRLDFATQRKNELEISAQTLIRQNPGFHQSWRSSYGILLHKKLDLVVAPDTSNLTVLHHLSSPLLFCDQAEARELKIASGAAFVLRYPTLE